MSQPLLLGLVAAAHTPFDDSGELRLDVVDRQIEHLLANGVQRAFPCGTTGESHSLTGEERRRLAERWLAATRGSAMKVIVHVGSNSVREASELAAHAQLHGAAGIAALAPSYFKPRSLSALIDCMANIAASAPNTPFYFYDIPILTGVNFSMPEFLANAAEKIPNLAGIKFTNSDLMSFQICLAAEKGRFDIPFGCDEYLLASLVLGARGAVGSTYNFAANVYHRLWKAFDQGDLATARAEQLRSVWIVERLAASGYMASAKCVMDFLGVNVGPPRLPHDRLTVDQKTKLKNDLETLGFFDWIK